jgi:hypothetical protein
MGFVRKDVNGDRYVIGGLSYRAMYSPARRQPSAGAAAFCFFLAALVLLSLFLFLNGCSKPGDAVCDRIEECECGRAESACHAVESYNETFWQNYESCWLACFDSAGCDGVCSYVDRRGGAGAQVALCVDRCVWE